LSLCCQEMMGFAPCTNETACSKKSRSINTQALLRAFGKNHALSLQKHRRRSCASLLVSRRPACKLLATNYQLIILCAGVRSIRPARHFSFFYCAHTWAKKNKLPVWDLYRAFCCNNRGLDTRFVIVRRSGD